MSTLHYRDARVYVAGYDLSGDHASIAVNLSAEMLDETAFGDTTRIKKGGLTNVDLAGSGHWDASAGHVDGILWGLVGLDDQIAFVFPNGITEGTGDGFACRGVVEKYDLKGDVGSLLEFDMTFMGRGIETI